MADMNEETRLREELAEALKQRDHWRERCIHAMVTGEYPVSPHDDDPEVVSLRQAAEYAFHGTAYAEKAKALRDMTARATAAEAALENERAATGETLAQAEDDRRTLTRERDEARAALAEARGALREAERALQPYKDDAGAYPYIMDAYRREQAVLAVALRDLLRRDQALRWVLGEAPLPDGRVFDREAFGYGKPDANDRNSDSPVGQFWWRIPLRLYSGINAALARAGEQEAPQPRIRVGVALIVEDEGRLLLGQRGKDPNRGKWVLPGGGIEPGESWRAAGARELLEETGLTVEAVEDRPLVLEIISGDEHRIILCARASVRSRDLVRHGSDLLDARFFKWSDVVSLDVSDAVRPILNRVRAGEQETPAAGDSRGKWDWYDNNPPRAGEPASSGQPTQDELRDLLDRAAPGADELAHSLKATFRLPDDNGPLNSATTPPGEQGKGCRFEPAWATRHDTSNYCKHCGKAREHHIAAVRPEQGKGGGEGPQHASCCAGDYCERRPIAPAQPAEHPASGLVRVVIPVPQPPPAGRLCAHCIPTVITAATSGGVFHARGCPNYRPHPASGGEE